MVNIFARPATPKLVYTGPNVVELRSHHHHHASRKPGERLWRLSYLREHPLPLTHVVAGLRLAELVHAHRALIGPDLPGRMPADVWAEVLRLAHIVRVDALDAVLRITQDAELRGVVTGAWA